MICDMIWRELVHLNQNRERWWDVGNTAVNFCVQLNSVDR